VLASGVLLAGFLPIRAGKDAMISRIIDKNKAIYNNVTEKSRMLVLIPRQAQY